MKTRLTKKRYVLIAGLVFLVIAIVVASYFISLLNRPVTNSVSASLGSYSANYYNIDLTPVKRTGKYVSFNSPKGLPLVSRSLISPISVEDFAFYVKDVYGWTMVIDIIQTPSGQLGESASYTTRKIHPDQYSESFGDFNGNQADIMTDKTFTNGFSKVAYLTHGNYVGIISLIGNDSQGALPLEKTFNMVLDSWLWLR